MSREIDERIVEMQFDNKQFEAGVSTTLSTLQKLKQSLRLDGATKGLEDVQATANKLNLSGVTSAVETVQAKFSALQVFAVTCLSNISNSAYQAGMNMVKAFTIDPIKTGFAEYETQINSVQTILANTSKDGTTLDQVNAALDELNLYADKTIYNFTEMTRNIGTFTAAGVDLKTSVAAIQGIANLAAVSGSTSQQASTAMYQLSQALSSGTVKLMDWNSVVNAGMGGQVFQDALKETARLHHINIDQMIEDEGSFRETLQKGWLSADILTETLSKFTTSGVNEYLAENSDITLKEIEQLREQAIATGNSSEAYKDMAKSIAESSKLTEDQIYELLNMSTTAEDAATKVKTFTQLMDTLKEAAQSGWTQSWEIMVGDFEESKALFTEVSQIFGDMISESANARNSMLEGAFSSGWNQLLAKGISDAEGYKESIKDVAKEHGIAFDEMIKETGSFDAALKKALESGDITSDMLTESVTHLGDSIRNMSEEEREAAGYTLEHLTSLEELESALKNGTISMDEFAEKMIKPSGRELLIDAARNSLNAMLAIVKPVKEAFRDIFPPTTSDQLYGMIDGLKEFSSHLIISETTSNNLKRTFKGLFAVLDIGRQAFSGLCKVVKPLASNLLGLGDGVLGTTASWGDWLVQLNETIKTTDVFGKAAEKVNGYIDNLKQGLITARDTLISFKDGIKAKIGAPGIEVINGTLERIHLRLTALLQTLSDIKTGTVTVFGAMGAALADSNLLQVLQTLWDGVQTIASGISSVLGSFMSGALTKIQNADFNWLLDLVNTLAAGGISVAIYKFVNGFEDAIEAVGSFKEAGLGILNEVRGCFEAYQNQLQAGTLLKIAGAIAILTASILVISLIDSEKLSASLGAVIVLFADLMASMAIFGKVTDNLSGVGKSVAAMIGLSTAVLILASALKKIGTLKTDELIKGVVGVLALTGTMVGAMVALSKFQKSAVKGATQMVIFAAAIKVLASACKDLSTMKPEELTKGLVGVGVLLAEVSLFLRTAKFSGKAITTATGIVVLAAAMKVMASACKDFGIIPTEQVIQGLAAIGVVLAEVALFTNASGYAKHVISSAVSLTIMGAAMKIFASAVKDFGSIPIEQLVQGLSGMGIALGVVALAMNVIPKNAVAIGAGLVVVGAALEIFADVMGKLGSMKPENILSAVAGLGIVLGELALALNLMNGTLVGSAALLVAAGALAVLTPVISILGAMPIENIGKALLTLAGAFVILGVAGAVLTGVVPTILSLGASFTLIGAGVALIGVGLIAAGAGLSAIAIGLTAVAAAGTAGATALVAALTVIVTGVLNLATAIIKTLGEAIISICEVLIEAAPAVGKALVTLFMSALGALVECVPALAEGILAILDGVLASLAGHSESIISSIMLFLIGVLDGIAANLPQLIVSAVNVIMAFFQGVVDALSGIDTDTLLKGIVGVGLLSALMLALSAVAGLIPGAMLGVLGMGVVIAELALVLTAVGALAQIPGLEWLISEGGDFLQILGTAIGQFLGGIVGGVAQGATAALPQIGNDLSAFMQNANPFIEGAKNIDAEMMEGVKSLAEIILILTAANILEGLTSWFTGGSSIVEFGKELAEFGPYIKQYADSVSGIDAATVEASATAAKSLAEFASALPNSGGVLASLVGDNSLSAFAEELVPFGTAIKKYADEVAGLDAETVTNSATAALSLAELASKLPNSGGLAGWFAGENDMAAFGEQLVPFGKSLKSYADSVAGLDAEVVTNSTSAALALAELAENLPNSGGMVSWFTGDNDMAAFGESLVSFGKNFKTYSTYMKDVDAGIVTTTTNAATSIVELQKSLPKEGGWFSDDMTLADFGSDMSSFGSYFATYYSYISGVNATQLAAVINETNSLVSMAKGMSDMDTKGMSSFSTGLTTLANNGINDFINAFTNAGSRVTTAATTMLTTFINGANSKKSDTISTFTTICDGIITAINNKQTNFQTAGSTLMIKFIAGVKSQDINTRTACTNVISGCVTAINNKQTNFQTAGSTLMIKFIAGVKSQDINTRTAFTNIITNCLTVLKNKYTTFQSVGSEYMVKLIGGVGEKSESVKTKFLSCISDSITAMKDKYNDFYGAGSYLVDGFVDGIDENIYKAAAKAKAMASAAAEAAKKELDEHSPSKVFYSIGNFAGEGFVNALDAYGKISAKAGGGMANSAIKGFTQAIAAINDLVIGSIDTEPTIRPVLDLSNVKSEVGKLNTMFSRTQAISISNGMNRTMYDDGQNGVNSGSGNTYQFTQNNYSPKALSRVEIYRQTKNQFSAMERMVET